MWRVWIGITIVLAGCGCGGNAAQTPEALKQGVLAARDEAKAAQEKKDAKAAGTAADRAEELLAHLGGLAASKLAEDALPAQALLPESEKAAVEARYWAELADEEHRLAGKVSGLKAKAYRAGRGAALTALFKGLSLAADQAAKQGLDKLPKPAQDAANYSAELAGQLTGRAALADGSPDWAGISADMDALSKQLPPELRMMMAAGMAVGAQDNFALYEVEAVDAAALASPEHRVYCRALRGWIYSLQGFQHLSAREFEALSSEEEALGGAGRCRELLAGVHLFMALEHCSGKEYAKADLELARTIKVMPDPWFADLQKGMADIVERERQAALDSDKGADSLYKLSAVVDGEWLAKRLAQRAEEVRTRKDKAGPLFGDPAFKRELVMHLVAKAAKDSPAATKLKGWLDAAGGLGRRFLEVMPGGGEKVDRPAGVVSPGRE